MHGEPQARLAGKFAYVQRVSLEFPLSAGHDISGVAYLGRLEETKELVVLRELSAEAASPEARAEVERAVSLRDPRLVGTLGTSVVGGRCYLVSEYAPGLPFAQLLARSDGWRGLSATALAYIACEALQALTVAQAVARDAGFAGALHGALTPWSIVVTTTGQVRLSGLGVGGTLDVLACDADPQASLRWASPERLAGEVLDPRSDVYSLGAVLWEALTRSSFDRVEALEASRTRRRAPDIDLLAVCRRALHPSPSRRFQTASEFAAALQRSVRAGGTGRGAEELTSLIQVVYPGSPSDACRLRSQGPGKAPRFDELMDIDEALDLDETTSRTDLSFIARALTGPPMEKPRAAASRYKRGWLSLAILLIAALAAKAAHLW